MEALRNDVVTKQPMLRTSAEVDKPESEKASSTPDIEKCVSLDVFERMTELRVYRRALLFGAFCDSKYKYIVTNRRSVDLFSAYEPRCGGDRKRFYVHNNDREVITMSWPIKITGAISLAPCVVPIHVFDGKDEELGTITRMDTDSVALYRIHGSCNRIQGPFCYSDVNFPVIQLHNWEEVGNIAKVWTPRSRQTRGISNTYVVKFDRKLDVNSKALIFSSAFIVDMLE